MLPIATEETVTASLQATCEFCQEVVRMQDVAGATEAETIADALDIHYIESCKMLTSC